jgi:hypothetical protein
VYRRAPRGDKDAIKRSLDQTTHFVPLVLRHIALVEGGRRRPRAAELRNEIDPPVLAAELTVGDDRKAEPFLQQDDLADRRVLKNRRNLRTRATLTSSKPRLPHSVFLSRYQLGG